MNRSTKPNTASKIKNTEKRVPKAEITYKVELTAEQKEAKRIIFENKVTLLIGPAGVSKSFISIATAIDMLFKRQINKIVISRPLVALEEIGVLPGEVSDKTKYYFLPIMANLYKLLDKAKADKLIQEGTIEILPIAFIQGTTIDDLLIIDESQNLSEFQIRSVLTRLGKDGKMVFTGDVAQTAIKTIGKENAFQKLINLDGKIEGFKVLEMTTNYRDPFVQEILKLY